MVVVAGMGRIIGGFWRYCLGLNRVWPGMAHWRGLEVRFFDRMEIQRLALYGFNFQANKPHLTLLSDVSVHYVSLNLLGEK